MATEASSVTDAAVDLEAMRRKALREPIDVDISDYGDEWCDGFLAGQENGITALTPEVERLKADHERAERYEAGLRGEIQQLSEQVAAQAEVVETARTIAAGWGHNLPGWSHCTSPGNCTWEKQTAALARLEALEHAQRNAAAVTQLQADMEAKA